MKQWVYLINLKSNVKDGIVLALILQILYKIKII